MQKLNLHHYVLAGTAILLGGSAFALTACSNPLDPNSNIVKVIPNYIDTSALTAPYDESKQVQTPKNLAELKALIEYTVVSGPNYIPDTSSTPTTGGS